MTTTWERSLSSGYTRPVPGTIQREASFENQKDDHRSRYTDAQSHPGADTVHATGPACLRPGSESTCSRSHQSTHQRTTIKTVHNRRCPRRQITAAFSGKSTGRRSQCTARAHRRHGLRSIQRFWRTCANAHPGEISKQRSALQRLSYHSPLLSHQSGPTFRAQSPCLQHGLHHRNSNRFSRSNRTETEQRRSAG